MTEPYEHRVEPLDALVVKHNAHEFLAVIKFYAECNWAAFIGKKRCAHCNYAIEDQGKKAQELLRQYDIQFQPCDGRPHEEES